MNVLDLQYLAAAVLVESRQFPAEESVVGEVSLQRQQELTRARQLLLADVGDGQQDAREWGEEMALGCGRLEFGDAASLSPATPPRRSTQRTGAAIDPMM